LLPFYRASLGNEATEEAVPDQSECFYALPPGVAREPHRRFRQDQVGPDVSMPFYRASLRNPSPSPPTATCGNDALCAGPPAAPSPAE
jgi:hypothetical protein